MSLTAENRANLEKLATYLESLPRRYKHFDMSFWLYGATPSAVEKYARENGGVASCGTAACAAGHGPAAGVLVPDSCIVGKAVLWSRYATSLFANDWGNHIWLFAGSWDEYDNHHWGAAARIRYLLANGEPPTGFNAAARKWRKHYAPYRIDAKATLSPTPQPSEEERR